MTANNSYIFLFGWRVVLFLGIVAFTGIPEGEAQSLLPENKIMTTIEPNEPNPFSFAKKVSPTKQAQLEDIDDEASAIQLALQKMSVAGYVEGWDGRTVLLDRIRVQVGDYLPSVIPKQTESVRVAAIHPDRIEFAFAEKTDKKGKKIERGVTVRYSLKPEVRYLLSPQDSPRRTYSVELQGVFPPPKKSEQDENSPQ